MDHANSQSGSGSSRGHPASTAFTSMSSGRRGESSNMTTGSSGSIIDTSDRFRMGTGIPAELRPLPLEHHPIPEGHPMISIWENTFKGVIEQKLNYYEIRWQHLSIYLRTFCGRKPTDKDLTIYIVAKQDETENWILFLDSVMEFLAGVGYEILVEIIDPRATGGLSTFPIGRNDPLLQDWEMVRQPLRRELEGTDWTALHAYRRGYDGLEADSTQTVVILCKNYFADHWKEVSLRLKHILKNLDYDIRLEIWQAQVSRGAFDPPPITISPDELEEVVYMGDGIGSMDKSGTLGGYITLHNKQQQGRTFGVTNYHVVRTCAMDTTCDTLGARIAQGSHTAEIFSPSPIDLEESIKLNWAGVEFLENAISSQKIKADLGDLRAQNRIKGTNNQINSLVDGRKRLEKFQSHLGNVHSFSGFRKTTDNFALDWALVGIKEGRLGSNEIRKSSWKILLFEIVKTGVWKQPASDFTETSTDCFNVNLPDEELWVMKRGRTTMDTWGRLNRIKPDVRVTDDGIERVYSAWEVVPTRGKDFARQGDSGAFVVNVRNEVCGLLFATSTPSMASGKSNGYITPIDMVFSDIEEMTGCKVLLTQ